MAKRKMSKNTEYEKWIMLLVCLLFYLSFCLVFGVFTNTDSEGYIAMDSSREPIYPLFLLLFRSIFPADIWMKMVILAQNIIMALAVWLFSWFLKKEFTLSLKAAYLTLLPHFGVAVLCQFAAGRGSIYSNSILTEGIALSLWIFFLYFLLKALYQYDLRFAAAALLLAAVMTDTRKQMAIAYIAVIAVLGICWAHREEYVKRMGIVLLMAAGSVILALGITRIYNYNLRGEFAQNTRDMNLVLTTTLYVSDREDGELIQEETVRELFYEVYDILDKKECNYKYAGSGWRNLEAHYGAHYDMITIDTTKDLFTDYAVKNGFSEGMDAEQEADRMSGEIVKALFMDNLKTYGKVYMASVGNGFVNTVAKKGKVLDYYALGVYIAYIGLMILCFLQKNTRKSALFALTVLLLVIINVGVTAALIFCQTRYMIYNMAMVYIALFLMCYRLVNN